MAGIALGSAGVLVEPPGRERRWNRFVFEATGLLEVFRRGLFGHGVFERGTAVELMSASLLLWSVAPSTPVYYLTYSSLIKSPVGDPAKFSPEKDKKRIRESQAVSRIAVGASVARAGSLTRCVE